MILNEGALNNGLDDLLKSINISFSSVFSRASFRAAIPYWRASAGLVARPVMASAMPET